MTLHPNDVTRLFVDDLLSQGLDVESIEEAAAVAFQYNFINVDDVSTMLVYEPQGSTPRASPAGIAKVAPYSVAQSKQVSCLVDKGRFFYYHQVHLLEDIEITRFKRRIH